VNALVIIAFFAIALLLTASRGAGLAFAWLYLPALIFLGEVPGVSVPGLPDPTASTAAIYGIVFGSLFGGRGPKLRLVTVDYIFVLMLATYIVSAMATEFFYTGVSIFGSLILQIVAPYFIARISLEQRATQRSALLALAISAPIVAAFALIEFRLWPHFYASVLHAIGVYDTVNVFGASRFGMFRARSSFIHPIDLGNSALLIFAAILILAERSGVGLRDRQVRIGVGSALVGLVTALSFTSFLGAFAALGLYLALATFPVSRRWLAPAVALLIASGIGYAGHLATAPFQFAENPVDSNALASSYWVRQLIIKQAWNFATTAGPFGWGRLVPVGNLLSLDNAYLLIAIQRGWVALGLWLALPLALASLAARGLRRARSARVIRPVLWGFSATIGTMIAMFTVWFGSAYASFFVVVLALTVNAALATAPVARPARVSSTAALVSPARPARPA
jgi:hypothetical protein